MKFQGAQSRGGHVAIGAQERLPDDRWLIFGAPLLVSGWLAICIWCVLSLGGLAVPPAAPAGDAARRPALAQICPCT